jgi:multicomponent Na+:H+ antiporter subunit B
MTSILLRAATKIIVPLQLAFSVYLLLRGHNMPGGGFIGGLIAAGAFSLYVIAFDVSYAKNKLKITPHSIIATGLSVAFLSAIWSILYNYPPLTGIWNGSIPLNWLGLGELKLGTPLLFDMGVYLTVIGVILLIIFTMAEED